MRKNVRLYTALLFALAFILYGFDAEAVNGQVYSGDGAVNNPTIPPGGWNVDQANLSSCFTCHVPNSSSGAPDKTSYLLTGHKNVLRMFPLPYYYPPYQPFALTDPAGQPYISDLFGNLFNWNYYTITLQGYCPDSQYHDATSCTNGGGAWISGSKPFYFIYGGWMDMAPAALYDGSYVQNGSQKTAVSYGCGRCHTTGFTMDTVVDSRCGLIGRPPVWVCRDPEYDFPGISWTTSTTSGQINLDPDGNGPAVSSSWTVASSGQGLQGVQCERCHDATKHNPATMTPKGTTATALCLQCHRQDHILSYTTGSLGINIVPTPFTDNASLPASEPLYPLPAIEVGGSDGSYAPQFYEYSTGMEYLNSPHAKFTGNFQQISDPSKYLSTFVTSSVDGGCTKCHDVHQSTVAAVNATAPFKKDCPTCHIEIDPAKIIHPKGPGTPQGDGSNIPAACHTCHMPRTNNGSGPSAHIWRIKSDASYTTFPTQDEWNAGQKTAFTAPSGTYTDAVWLDIDLVCGQCHGSSSGQAAGIPQFSKETLAPVAQAMHTGILSDDVCLLCHSRQQGPYDPVNQGVNHHNGACSECHGTAAWPLHQGNPGPGNTNAGCLTCHSSPQGIYPAIDELVNHHGGPLAACITCHTTHGGVSARNGGKSYNVDGNDFCLTCHVNTGSTAAHHSVPALKTAGKNCSDCHGYGGVVPAAPTLADCQQCHSANTWTRSAATGSTVVGIITPLTNHHLGNGTGCTYCHNEGPFTLAIEAANTATTGFYTGQTKTFTIDGNDFCLTCHINTGTTAAHHAVPALKTASKNCNTCHGYGGVAPPVATPADCQQCHASNTWTSTFVSRGTITIVDPATNHHGGGCNQCHAEGPVAPGEGPHIDASPFGTGNAGCLTCHSTQQGAYAPIVELVNHHGGPQAACTTCHGSQGGVSARNGGKIFTIDGNDFCLTCHVNTGTTAAHHSTPALKPASKNCQTCHNYGGVTPPPATNTDCLQCHSLSWAKWNGTTPVSGTTMTIMPNLGAGKNHHGSTPGETDCTKCHNEGSAYLAIQAMYSGYTYTNNSMCLACHTEAVDGTGIPFIQGTNHHNGLCISCHDPSNPLDSSKVTGPGVLPVGTTCTGCHAERLSTMSYHNQVQSGLIPAQCQTCHQYSKILSGQTTSTFYSWPGVVFTDDDHVCGQCHGGSSGPAISGVPYFNASDLTSFANNIHNIKPTARFHWSTSSTTDYLVLYDATASTCPSGATCTYSWSTGETGITASHQFSNAATTTVTLTVTASTGGSDSTSQAVTPKYVGSHPTTVSMSATVSGFTASGTYSVSGGIPPYTVTANWGDGTGISTLTGGTFTHTYVNPGTYTITITAIDSGDADGNYKTTGTASQGVTISAAALTISGTVTRADGTTPLSGALVQIRGTSAGTTSYVQITGANGTYSQGSLKAGGTYTVSVTKSGYTFPTSPQTGVTPPAVVNFRSSI